MTSEALEEGLGLRADLGLGIGDVRRDDGLEPGRATGVLAVPEGPEDVSADRRVVELADVHDEGVVDIDLEEPLQDRGAAVAD